jgi:hypothetical protein
MHRPRVDKLARTRVALVLHNNDKLIIIDL